MSEAPKDPLTSALGFLKHWTNYLLVTTVPALGWVALSTGLVGRLQIFCIWCLTLSIIFGIFTLALIRLDQEQRSTISSNYDVRAELWAGSFRLIYVCVPQHLFHRWHSLLRPSSYAQALVTPQGGKPRGFVLMLGFGSSGAGAVLLE
jgi:hypothetical protein